MKVDLISITQPLIPLRGMTGPEDLIIYTARVSSPQNQGNIETGPKLLRYLISHGHWSPFEMVDMTVEIETSRAVAAQILRHRSFSFQEFSQRYSIADLGFEDIMPRRQDEKNRQASHDDLSTESVAWFASAYLSLQKLSEAFYKEALGRGIAKECARFLLPLSVRTRLYMKGSVRSYIHYLQSRTAVGTQKEHRDVANAILAIFRAHFPTTAEAVFGESETP